VPEAPSVSLLARASAAAPGSIERQLLVAAAFCEVALDDAVLVGGTAVHLYTGSYRPTDIDLVGYWQDGYQERLAALGFTRSGRHWLIRFGDGEAIGVEVPDHRLFELAADRPVMLDLNPGKLAVISVNDLMIDRLLAATGGEPITFDEALRLAVAAYASISWTALEDRSRDAARTGSLADQALPKVLQRVRRAAVRALRQR